MQSNQQVCRMPQECLPIKMYVMMATAGIVAGPIDGHNAAGSVMSHSIMQRLVCRV